MKDQWDNLSIERSWDREVSERCWDFLDSHYGGETRHYHNFKHISSCLSALERSNGRDCLAMELAIWFHDVIYIATESDNELASGKAAVRWLNELGEDKDLCARVDRLIQVTDHKTVPEDDDETLLIDIDLLILGSDPDGYSEYREQVRREYSFVSDAAYSLGRSSVLQGFLNRERIFKTDLWGGLLETQARKNLEREIWDLR